ncbi:MAG TPA: SDR family oxidoreductase [Acidobacteriaceae bacterium]
MKASSKGKAVLTGASSGIGAICADRLARRGHDLILVARNRERLDAVATRIEVQTARSVEVIVADLNERADLARVEEILRDEASITALVNNAGVIAPTRLLDCNVDRLEEMIDLNVTALVRLTYAALPGFLKRGGGAIINIASVVGITPEFLNGVYGGTKAFVLAFSRSLHKEFAEKNIRVQVALPGVTATGFWDNAGPPLQQPPSEMVMKADEMVDAALGGFDQGEFIIPSLPDLADWEAYETARQNLVPKLSLSSPAARYCVSKEHRELQSYEPGLASAARDVDGNEI